MYPKKNDYTGDDTRINVRVSVYAFISILTTDFDFVRMTSVRIDVTFTYNYFL